MDYKTIANELSGCRTAAEELDSGDRDAVRRVRALRRAAQFGDNAQVLLRRGVARPVVARVLRAGLRAYREGR